MRADIPKQYNAIIELPTIAPPVKLGIYTRDDILVNIDFLPKSTSNQPSNSRIAQLVVAQLEDYFENPAHQFTIPLQEQGSQFQQRVRIELQATTSGQTLTYGELAKKTKSSPRAIGGACKANAVPIVVPCHRIVAKSGAGGYCGDTSGEKMQIKNWLLQHEFATQFNLTG